MGFRLVVCAETSFAGVCLATIDEDRTLHVKEDLGVQLNETVYVLDSSIIDLCLSL